MCGKPVRGNGSHQRRAQRRQGGGDRYLALDAAKGFLAMELARQALAQELAFSKWWVGATAIAALLGHIFPIWLRFHGGKGVATGLGIFLICRRRPLRCRR
ncbi:MAG: glycerol-3-phosphate acyltransferase [Pyrinomonadaceae bacterium]